MMVIKTRKKVHVLLDANKWDDISRQIPMISATYLVDLLLQNFQQVLAESRIDVKELIAETSGRTIHHLKDANS